MATDNLGWQVTCDGNCGAQHAPPGGALAATSKEAVALAVAGGWTSTREGAHPKWRRVEYCPTCSAERAATAPTPEAAP